MKKISLLTLLLGILMVNSSAVFAQSKIKDGTVAKSSNLPDANALVEFESNNKGVLLPRVALTATNNKAPLTDHVRGMMVYNTATAGTAPNNVTPGFYYNTGNGWIRFVSANTSTVDSTDDGWKNDTTNTQVKLAYQSNGNTTRATGTEFVIKDNGMVGIGTATPSAKLEVNGTVEIATINTVGNDKAYRPLVWNTSTQRIETTGNNDNINKESTAAAGGSLPIYTFNVNGSGVYEIKVKVSDGCSGTSYNKFVAAGDNQNNKWVLNFIGGMSATGTPTATRPNNNTVKTTNPSPGCGDGSNGTALDYTLSVNPGTGELTLTNDGNKERIYEIILEKVFD